MYDSIITSINQVTKMRGSSGQNKPLSRSTLEAMLIICAEDQRQDWRDRREKYLQVQKLVRISAAALSALIVLSAVILILNIKGII